MISYFCQMRTIGDGIRLDQHQPRPSDCCNQPAHDFILLWGQRQWLCPEHYDDHMETRGILRMEGEGLDAAGNPV
jgi:hypothetical protein